MQQSSFWQACLCQFAFPRDSWCLQGYSDLQFRLSSHFFFMSPHWGQMCPDSFDVMTQMSADTCMRGHWNKSLLSYMNYKLKTLHFFLYFRVFHFKLACGDFSSERTQNWSKVLAAFLKSEQSVSLKCSLCPFKWIKWPSVLSCTLEPGPAVHTSSCLVMPHMRLL